MFLDIILLMVFLGSLFLLWYRVSEKIPELAFVPDVVIADRLKEDSAKVRLFILHLKTFYKEQHYRDILFNFLAKTLHKLHIGLMRLDNFLVAYVKKIKPANGNGTARNEPSPKEEEKLMDEAVEGSRHQPAFVPVAVEVVQTEQGVTELEKHIVPEKSLRPKRVKTIRSGLAKIQEVRPRHPRKTKMVSNPMISQINPEEGV